MFNNKVINNISLTNTAELRSFKQLNIIWILILFLIFLFSFCLVLIISLLFIFFLCLVLIKSLFNKVKAYLKKQKDKLINFLYLRFAFILYDLITAIFVNRSIKSLGLKKIFTYIICSSLFFAFYIKILSICSEIVISHYSNFSIIKQSSDNDTDLTNNNNILTTSVNPWFKDDPSHRKLPVLPYTLKERVKNLFNPNLENRTILEESKTINFKEKFSFLKNNNPWLLEFLNSNNYKFNKEFKNNLKIIKINPYNADILIYNNNKFKDILIYNNNKFKDILVYNNNKLILPLNKINRHFSGYDNNKLILNKINNFIDFIELDAYHYSIRNERIWHKYIQQYSLEARYNNRLIKSRVFSWRSMNKDLMNFRNPVSNLNSSSIFLWPSHSILMNYVKEDLEKLNIEKIRTSSTNIKEIEIESTPNIEQIFNFNIKIEKQEPVSIIPVAVAAPISIEEEVPISIEEEEVPIEIEEEEVPIEIEEDTLPITIHPKYSRTFHYKWDLNELLKYKEIKIQQLELKIDKIKSKIEKINLEQSHLSRVLKFVQLKKDKIEQKYLQFLNLIDFFKEEVSQAKNENEETGSRLSQLSWYTKEWKFKKYFSSNIPVVLEQKLFKLNDKEIVISKFIESSKILFNQLANKQVDLEEQILQAKKPIAEIKDKLKDLSICKKSEAKDLLDSAIAATIKFKNYYFKDGSYISKLKAPAFRSLSFENLYSSILLNKHRIERSKNIFSYYYKKQVLLPKNDFEIFHKKILTDNELRISREWYNKIKDSTNLLTETNNAFEKKYNQLNLKLKGNYLNERHLLGARMNRWKINLIKFKKLQYTTNLLNYNKLTFFDRLKVDQQWTNLSDNFIARIYYQGSSKKLEEFFNNLLKIYSQVLDFFPNSFSQEKTLTWTKKELRGLLTRSEKTLIHYFARLNKFNLSETDEEILKSPFFRFDRQLKLIKDYKEFLETVITNSEQQVKKIKNPEFKQQLPISLSEQIEDFINLSKQTYHVGKFHQYTISKDLQAWIEKLLELNLINDKTFPVFEKHPLLKKVFNELILSKKESKELDLFLKEKWKVLADISVFFFKVKNDDNFEFSHPQYKKIIDNPIFLQQLYKWSENWLKWSSAVLTVSNYRSELFDSHHDQDLYSATEFNDILYEKILNEDFFIKNENFFISESELPLGDYFYKFYNNSLNLINLSLQYFPHQNFLADIKVPTPIDEILDQLETLSNFVNPIWEKMDAEFINGNLLPSEINTLSGHSFFRNLFEFNQYIKEVKDLVFILNEEIRPLDINAPSVVVAPEIPQMIQIDIGEPLTIFEVLSIFLKSDFKNPEFGYSINSPSPIFIENLLNNLINYYPTIIKEEDVLPNLSHSLIENFFIKASSEEQQVKLTEIFNSHLPKVRSMVKIFRNLLNDKIALPNQNQSTVNLILKENSLNLDHMIAYNKKVPVNKPIVDYVCLWAKNWKLWAQLSLDVYSLKNEAQEAKKIDKIIYYNDFENLVYQKAFPKDYVFPKKQDLVPYLWEIYEQSLSLLYLSLKIFPQNLVEDVNLPFTIDEILDQLESLSELLDDIEINISTEKLSEHEIKIIHQHSFFRNLTEFNRRVKSMHFLLEKIKLLRPILGDVDNNDKSKSLFDSKVKKIIKKKISSLNLSRIVEPNLFPVDIRQAQDKEAELTHSNLKHQSTSLYSDFKSSTLKKISSLNIKLQPSSLPEVLIEDKDISWVNNKSDKVEIKLEHVSSLKKINEFLKIHNERKVSYSILPYINTCTNLIEKKYKINWDLFFPPIFENSNNSFLKQAFNRNILKPKELLGLSKSFLEFQNNKAKPFYEKCKNLLNEKILSEDDLKAKAFYLSALHLWIDNWTNFHSCFLNLNQRKIVNFQSLFDQKSYSFSEMDKILSKVFGKTFCKGSIDSELLLIYQKTLNVLEFSLKAFPLNFSENLELHASFDENIKELEDLKNFFSKIQTDCNEILTTNEKEFLTKNILFENLEDLIHLVDRSENLIKLSRKFYISPDEEAISTTETEIKKGRVKFLDPLVENNEFLNTLKDKKAKIKYPPSKDIQFFKIKLKDVITENRFKKLHFEHKIFEKNLTGGLVTSNQDVADLVKVLDDKKEAIREILKFFLSDKSSSDRENFSQHLILWAKLWEVWAKQVIFLNEFKVDLFTSEFLKSASDNTKFNKIIYKVLSKDFFDETKLEPEAYFSTLFDRFLLSFNLSLKTFPQNPVEDVNLFTSIDEILNQLDKLLQFADKLQIDCNKLTREEQEFLTKNCFFKNLAELITLGDDIKALVLNTRNSRTDLPDWTSSTKFI